MEHLPEEVLINIFQYFNGRKLKKLMLVCKSWYNVITQSYETMKRLPLDFQEMIHLNQENRPLCRRYYKMTLWNLRKLPFNKSVLDQNLCTQYVRHLEIVRFPLSSRDLNIITAHFINLAYLHLMGVPLAQDHSIICDEEPECRMENEIIIPKLNLEDVDHEILPYLMNLQALELHITDSDRNRLNENALCDFVTNQKYLTTFHVSEICKGTNLLFFNDISGRVKFKLKKLHFLYYAYYGESSQYIINMLSFLDTQAKSVEDLYISRNCLAPNIFKFVLTDFINLQALHIDTNSVPNESRFYTHLPKNYNLKKLRMETHITMENYQNFDGILSHYPAIVKLKLDDTDSATANFVYDSLAKHLPFLEDLYVTNIKNSVVPNSKMKSLRKLTIQQFSEPEHLLKVVKAHEETLEYIRFPWIPRYVDKEFLKMLTLKNLRHMSIGARFYSAQIFYDAIIKNHFNLKSTEIVVHNLDDIISLKYTFPITDRQPYYDYFMKNNDREPFTD